MARLSIFLSCVAAFLPVVASAQSVDVNGSGGVLSFSLNSDSTTCSLSSFKHSKFIGTYVLIPEFVTSDERKFQVVSIGDGSAVPFVHDANLSGISIPQSVKSVAPTAFSLCSGLKRVNVSAAAPPQLGRGAFLKTKVDSLFVPASAVEVYKDSPWGKIGENIFPLYTFSLSHSGGGSPICASVSTPVNFADLFYVFSDETSGVSARTDVSMTHSLNFPVVSFGASADYKTIAARLRILPTIQSYSATFRGQQVNNLATRTNGVFGTLKTGSKVENLVLDNAYLLVDPEDEVFEKSDDGRTLYVSVFAARNHGVLRTVGFAGSVVMSKGSLPDGVEKVVVSLVGRQTVSGAVNGFLYLENQVSQSRSVQYITDCAGVGKDESLASKVAIRANPDKQQSSVKKTKPGETSFDPDAERFRYTTCAFTDEEFASGLVAYWLNFRGLGFSGDYKPTWRQGLAHPEAETNVSRTLCKVDYALDGESFLTSAPEFANGGDRITLSYSKTPVSISVGGQKVTPVSGSTVISYSAGAVVAISWTNANFVPTEKPKTPGVEITTKGSLISVSGAGKQVKGLYTVTGIKICETTGSTLSAPKPGVYSVRIGKRSWRVLAK